jgi:hypothetical protein
MGIIELLLPFSGDGGEAITIYERIVIFKTQDYTIFVTFGVIDELRSALSDTFDGMIDGIQSLETP